MPGKARFTMTLLGGMLLALIGFALAVSPAQAEDPAEELYKQALQQLESNKFERAAQLYQQLSESHAAHARVKEALYWEAFSRYRLGKDRELKRAVEVLERLQTEFPRAEIIGDAEQLAIRIEGKLAERGHAEAAERVYRLAERFAVREAHAGTRDRHEADDDCKDDVRAAALNALLHMDTEKARPLLHKVLLNRDECAELRVHAMFILAQSEDDTDQDLFIDILHKDPDSEVRQQAMFWLGQNPSEKTLAVIERVIKEDDDPEMIEKALFALSQDESPRSTQILRDLAVDSKTDSEKREMAIFWLGQRADTDDLAFMQKLYGDLEEQEAKERVLYSVAQIEGEASMRWLMDVALDENEPVQMRARAVFWAGQMGEIAAEELYRLYKQVDSREMREQLAFVLSQQDGPQSVETMMRLAREEEDMELKAQMIFWLGQTDDARVLEFLEEIING